jgi:hypothetical protein
MLLPSRLLNQPQHEKDTMKSVTNVAFYVQIEILGYKTFNQKTITNTKTDINLNLVRRRSSAKRGSCNAKQKPHQIKPRR